MKIIIYICLLIFLFSTVILASENLPVYEPEVCDEFSPGLYMGCTLACAMTWDLASSSNLELQGNNKYTVEMLNDGDFNTAWCEGAEDYGIGEWVEFYIKNYEGRKSENTTFWGFAFANGYRKNETVWRENSRVKQFLVEINGEPLFYLNLADTMKDQYFHFFDGNYTVSEGDVIRLTITDVYPGDIYSDTCISEMVPHGAH